MQAKSRQTARGARRFSGVSIEHRESDDLNEKMMLGRFHGRDRQPALSTGYRDLEPGPYASGPLKIVLNGLGT